MLAAEKNACSGRKDEKHADLAVPGGIVEAKNLRIIQQ